MEISALLYGASEKEAVDTMQKMGEDANGLPRDFNTVVSSAEPDIAYLAAWADANKYPIRSTADDVKDNVVALLQGLEVGGTDRYILESARQEQLGVYHLPFYVFTFTTKENLGRYDNMNRDDIRIAVRVGGTDLSKGEGELVYFSDGGYLWRKLEAQPQKSKPIIIPGAKQLE